MARKPSARVVLNRQAVDQLRLAVADGLLEVGRTIIELAAENAPDSPYEPYPTGEGLPKQGGVLAMIDNQKVGGWSQRGTQPRKPKAARNSKGITVIAGFGFPARFAELGTVRTPAQPFLSPAEAEVRPHIPDIIRPFVEAVK